MSSAYQDVTLDDFFARWNSIFLAYICYYVTVVETRQRVNDQMHSLTTDTHTHTKNVGYIAVASHSVVIFMIRYVLLIQLQDIGKVMKIFW